MMEEYSMKFCENCKFAEKTNVYCEDRCGELVPLLWAWVAYCPKVDDYVRDTDHCHMWEL